MMKNLITAKQAAEILQVTPRTVMNLARRGCFPEVDLGRRYRYRLSDIDAFVSGRASEVSGEVADPNVN